MRYYLLVSCIIIGCGSLNARAGNDWLSAAERILRKGGDRDSLAIYTRNAIDYFEKNDSLRAWIRSYKVLGRIARDELNEPQLAITYLERATEKNLFRQPKTVKEWEELGWLYVNLGYTFKYGLEQYEQAIDNYQRAKEILVDQLAIEDEDVSSFIYQAMANIHTRLGDFQAAEVLLEKVRHLSLSFGNNNAAAEAYSDLGILYQSMGENRKAIGFCEKGLQLSGLYYDARGLLEGNMAKIYTDLEDFPQALKFCYQSKKSFLKAFEAYDYLYAKHYLANISAMEGAIYVRQEKFELAERAFQQSFDYFTFLYPHGKLRDLGKLYVDWADLYKDWGKLDKALVYYQKALNAVIEDFHPTTTLDNPTAEKCVPENTLVDILFSKAEALEIYFDQTGNLEHLKKALECHELIFGIEKQIRRYYQYETSKLYNIEDSRKRSEGAIAIALKLQQHTRNPEYGAVAFTFAERNKSILLLEAFRKAKAENIAGVSPELLTRERALQTEIAFVEKQLYNAKVNDQTDSIVLHLDEKLLSLKNDYTNLILKMEAESPQYYNLKYNFATAGIETVRNQFKTSEEAFIEYFTGEENIYAFVITATEFEVFTFPKDFALEDQVIQFRNAIEQFQHSNVNRQKLADTYRDLGYQLYLKLFAPFKSLHLPQRLTIVPSGILGYLPFDALLMQAVEGNRFSEFPYLVRDKIISYNFSATLQTNLTDKTCVQPDFAGFAPQFEGQGGFQALHYNVNTVATARDLLGGEVFLAHEATLRKFNAVAGQYGILHLATHAQANTAQGDFSFIVFADGKGGYDSLFVRDLYLLELHADMVVLSACETAVGKLYEGEGVISLARAFLYAGARSVVTTLWSINDDANRKLMDQFYHHLKTGSSKAEALQMAKITQIEESDNLNAHPVYWAAFAAVGNMDAVYTPVDWAWIGLGFLLAAGFLFSIWLIRRTQNISQPLVRRREKKKLVKNY